MTTRIQGKAFSRKLRAEQLPEWYTLYFGDFLWAMLVYFLIAVSFGLENKLAFAFAIITTYLIEISQLFHPGWLDALRFYRIVGLVIGYGFLWSDIIAYTLGISVGVLMDVYISTGKYARVKGNR